MPSQAGTVTISRFNGVDAFNSLGLRARSPASHNTHAHTQTHAHTYTTGRINCTHKHAHTHGHADVWHCTLAFLPTTRNRAAAQTSTAHAPSPRPHTRHSFLGQNITQTHTRTQQHRLFLPSLCQHRIPRRAVPYNIHAYTLHNLRPSILIPRQQHNTH